MLVKEQKQDLEELATKLTNNTALTGSLTNLSTEEAQELERILVSRSVVCGSIAEYIRVRLGTDGTGTHSQEMAKQYAAKMTRAIRKVFGYSL